MHATMTRGLVDLNSLCWTSLMNGNDKEHGRTVTSAEGKEVRVNSALYGYENALAYLLETMDRLKLVPHQMILIPDGINSKQIRQNMHPLYKAGRDKVPEAYEEFNKLKGMLTQQLLDVGAQMCWLDGGLEADDVIGYVAQNLEGIRWIISGDKDLAQLVGPGPKDRLNILGKAASLYPGVNLGQDDTAWTGYIHHYRRGVIDENPFGPFQHRFIPVAIALLGDSVDKIPGASGFGEKALAELIAIFGDDGLELMEGLILRRELDQLAEDVPSMKKLQKAIDDAKGVYMSYQLGRLHTEKVNDLRRPLKWKVGMVKEATADTDPALKKWAAHYSLVHAENYEQAYRSFGRQVARTPDFCLDLETWAGEESDEWLARRTAKGGGVDVMGSSITGVGLSFGANGQHQFYLMTDHVEEDGITNLTLDQVRSFLELIPQDRVTIAHNAGGFELPVLFNHFGEAWKSNGWRGMFPNMVDSRIAAIYWDEDQFTHGLKALSKLVLGYDQVSYEQVTREVVRFARPDPVEGEDGTMYRPDPVWEGTGKVVGTALIPLVTVAEKPIYRVWTQEEEDAGAGEFGEAKAGEEVLFDGERVVVGSEEIKFTDFENGWVDLTIERKMNELTGSHVLSYGLDDTTTAHALWRYFRCIMELEDTLATFFLREVKPVYLSALAYVRGIPISLEHVANLSRADDEKFTAHKAVLDEMLTGLGWDGTVCPSYQTMNRAGVIEAFGIITGEELKTRCSSLKSLAKEVENAGHPMLGQLVAEDDVFTINNLVAMKFSGAPKFDVASPKQMANLIYTTLKLPVRLRNKATKAMKEKGIYEGTPRTDEDSIKMAQKMGDVVKGSQECRLLSALMEMKSINTKRGLYYGPYPNAVHWKTRRLHPELVQSGTNTKRWSARNPNIQQLDSKAGGIRSCILPHHRNAVVVSLDESAQEIRQAADYCRDPNLLSCYLGTKDQLRDVHSIVACRIAGCSYDEFRARLTGRDPDIAAEASAIRGIAKICNFASLYGAMAPKLAESLGIPENEAQAYIDAIYTEYAKLTEWKSDTEEFAAKHGWVPIHGGGRRHLAKQLLSSDRFESSKALRQASNARIQGAGANQIKGIMSKVWDSSLLDTFDMQWYMPVHDEAVFSVRADDAVEVIRVMHGLMTEKFLDMVPSASSIGIGRDFGRLVELGETFSEPHIAATLARLFKTAEAA